MRAAAVVMVVTAGWCLACSGLVEEAAEQAIEVSAGNGADVELGGDGALEMKTPDGGDIAIGGSAAVPADLPVGLPGGGAGWTAQMTAKTPEGTLVVLQVPAGASAGLADHFRAELGKLGCAEPNTVEMPGMLNLGCEHKGGYDVLSVTVTGEGDQSSVQLIYKPTSGEAAAAPADAPAPTDGTPTP